MLVKGRPGQVFPDRVPGVAGLPGNSSANSSLLLANPVVLTQTHLVTYGFSSPKAGRFSKGVFNAGGSFSFRRYWSILARRSHIQLNMGS